MMVPEAWENHASMDPARRAFYQYHSTMMEPWDGPACVTFTDGTQVGAVLDRNGLRPGRYWVTDDGLVVLSSEVGVLDIDPAKVVRKGRLQPGKMFLVDTAEHRIIEDDEIKAALAAEQPVRGVAGDRRDRARRTCPSASTSCTPTPRSPAASRPSATPRKSCASSSRRWPGPAASRSAPWARTRRSPRCPSAPGCSSTTSPSCSRRSPTRRWTPSARSSSPRCAPRSGPQGNLLEPTAASCRSVTLPFPVIDNDELAKLIHINADGDMPGMKAATLSGLYRVSGGGEALAARIERDLRRGRRRHRGRRPADRPLRPALRRRARADPVAAAHLRRAPPPHPHQAAHPGGPAGRGRRRPRGPPRRAAHRLRRRRGQPVPRDGVRRGPASAPAPSSSGIEPEQAIRNLIYALGKGVLKVMSKMGISTVASYRGAQVFEAVGLDEAFVEKYFNGTATKIGGAGLDVVAKEVAARHAKAYPASGIAAAHRALEIGGEYQWRREGEPHLFDPETVFRLQHATRNRRYDIFKKYTDRVNEQSERLMTLRGLFGFKPRPRADLRSTRSSRSPRSSSASPPAPCRTAPSPRRRTRPSPSP